MPGKIIQIGSRTFPTQKTALAEYRQIKSTYPLGIPVAEPDHAEWLELLMRHPYLHDFEEHGIHHFEARKDLRNPRTTGMVVVNVAGEAKPFSIERCVSGKPMAPRAAGMRAMRAEVSNEFLAEKKVARAGDQTILVEARHRPGAAFVEMVDDFCASFGGALDEVPVRCDPIHGFRLTDRELARQWRKFYRAKAQVDIVIEEAAGAD